MAYSQKYCLVAFYQPQAIGTEFSMTEWPLHVTLADVFAIDRADTSIDEKIRNVVESHNPFGIKVGEQTTLGITPVTLLDKTDALVDLHNRLVDLLEQNGATFNTPEFTRAGFLPHCTIQTTGQLQKGDIFTVRELSLIDMFVDNDWQRRKVLNTFELRRE